MTQVFGYTPPKVEDGEQYVRFVAIYDDGDTWEFQVRDGAGKLNTVKVPAEAVRQALTSAAGLMHFEQLLERKAQEYRTRKAEYERDGITRGENHLWVMANESAFDWVLSNYRFALTSVGHLPTANQIEGQRYEPNPPDRVEWRPIDENTPRDGTPILAALQVRNTSGGKVWEYWEAHVIAFDDEAGEIIEDLGWAWEDYEIWKPLDLPPLPIPKEG